MAQKVTVVLVDDLDGGTATQTVRFGLDQTTFEIDLSDENADVLRSALAPFVAKARRVSAGSAARRRRSGGEPTSPPGRMTKVRTWARDNGYQVGDRGRIPGEIIDAYNAANA